MPAKPSPEPKKCPECDSRNFKSIEKHYEKQSSLQPGVPQFVTIRYKCQRCLETWRETVPQESA